MAVRIGGGGSLLRAGSDYAGLRELLRDVQSNFSSTRAVELGRGQR